jgi:hypothetical protein
MGAERRVVSTLIHGRTIGSDRVRCGPHYRGDLSGAKQDPDTPTSLLVSISDGWLYARAAPDAWSPYEVCGRLLHIEQTL